MVSRRTVKVFASAALAVVALGFAPVPAPVIETGDVDRFYALYDAAGGRPTTEQLQAYIDGGSEGLKTLARLRRVTGERMAEAIAARPGIYEDARRCAAVLPAVRIRLARALERLGRLYPEARFPPVTIAVGRGKPVAIGSPATGVQVGLEALCAADFINPDIEDRFVFVLAHEYAHVQQPAELADKAQPTVLEGALMEGGAEFVAELIAGEPAYAYLPALVRGREAEIGRRFLADRHKTDVADWLYNSTPDQPGDLGYWIGYRITRAYYERASDKRRALRDILTMADAEAFLAASGWRPGD